MGDNNVKSSLVLGLDIGIASVGWGIIDEITNQVVDCGVRLFESADASKNEDRRGFRGARRNKRRKNNRLNDAHNLLESYQIFRPNKLTNNPLELRVKGLNSQITLDELYIAIYNLIKYRGISYIDDLEFDEKESGGLSENAKEIQNKYVCQIQLERLEKNQSFRGTTIDKNGKLLINIFTTSAYEKELRKLLSTQKEYYPNIIDDNLIEKLVELIRRKREYYIGPGNELSRTNYGVYKIDGVTKDNLFDELRGKCSIYNGKHGMESEFRASAASYTAQYYNALNDLNNLRINNDKLTKKQREELLDYFINNKTSQKKGFYTNLKKLFSIHEEEVSGFRIDKDNKPEYHCFDIYKSMKKFLDEKHSIDYDKFSINEMDLIADVLTLNTETDSINKGLAKLDFLTQEEIDAFREYRQKNVKNFSKWHNFSYRLINQIVPEMLETGDEQYTTITRMQIVQKNNDDIAALNKIDVEDILDEIYNPVVKRAIRQTIRIVNELLKTYEFKDIVIEMAREDNEVEKKKAIQQMQKSNEDEISKAIKYAGLEDQELDFRNHKQLALKLKLYARQQGICLYSGKSIDITTLLKNDMDYEIDHIIPVSISFDDSQNNKALVLSDENAKKGNKTPYQYLLNNGKNWNYETFKAYVKDLKAKNHIKEKQMNNLLFEKDISKEEVVQGFISRNLNDTRYASRVVLNSLQTFFEAKGRITKVKVVNGSYTANYRKKVVKVDKERDKDYSHHGVDALICAYSVSNLDTLVNDAIDLNTGEILDITKFKELSKKDEIITNKTPYHIIQDRLIEAAANMKYSHKVDKKINRAVSDQTIYGTRIADEEIFVVNKIKDIYDDIEYEKFVSKLTKKEKDKQVDNSDIFLMKKHDIKTWNILMKIMDTYKGEKNPFRKHKEEFKEPIRKYSKKGNGPFIKELKYLDHKLGSHIPITNNYDSKTPVILESLNPYRSDIYYDNVNKRFNVVPLKYSDFKFINGEYKLELSRYEEILKEEKLLLGNQTLSDLESIGHEFRFSLYKNNIIEIGHENEIMKVRFVSKSYSEKNRFEIKYINRKVDKQIPKTARKDTTIFRKINVDILGNEYYVDKEKIVLTFKLDNKMIK